MTFHPFLLLAVSVRGASRSSSVGRFTTERTETTEKDNPPFLWELRGLCSESPVGLRLCSGVRLDGKTGI